MLTLISFIPAIVFLVIFLGFYLIFCEFQKQQNEIAQSSKYRRSRRIKNYPPTKLPPPRKLDFITPHPLRTQLFAMVGGDHRTVERLLGLVIKHHPGMNEEWYYSKAIYDLERDRRR